MLYRFRLVYATVEDQVSYGQVNQHDCILQYGEYIHHITSYKGDVDQGLNLHIGIMFTTNMKVCGPWGITTDVTEEYTGWKLLYLYGRMGSAIDKIGAAFWDC